MCECTVGVDVRDRATEFFISIPVNIAMGCIVLGRQMNVYFGTSVCQNTIPFVGMDVRFLFHADPRQHDQMHSNQSL